MSADELLPCPFCGSKAHIEQPGTRRQSCIVECDSCGLRHESGDEGNRCGTSWNRRAAPAAPSDGAQAPQTPHGYVGSGNYWTANEVTAKEVSDRTGIPMVPVYAAPVAADAVAPSLTAEDVERQYRDGVHLGSGLPRATCPCGFCAKHRLGGKDLPQPDERAAFEALRYIDAQLTEYLEGMPADETTRKLRDVARNALAGSARAASTATATDGEHAAIVRDNPDDIGTIIEATRPLAAGTKLYTRAAAPQAASTPPTPYHWRDTGPLETGEPS